MEHSYQVLNTRTQGSFVVDLRNRTTREVHKVAVLHSYAVRFEDGKLLYRSGDHLDPTRPWVGGGKHRATQLEALETHNLCVIQNSVGPDDKTSKGYKAVYQFSIVEIGEFGYTLELHKQFKVTRA